MQVTYIHACVHKNQNNIVVMDIILKQAMHISTSMHPSNYKFFASSIPFKMRYRTCCLHIKCECKFQDIFDLRYRENYVTHNRSHDVMETSSDA